MFRKKLNQNGFTLIELMIVIVIISILAGIAITRIKGLHREAIYASGRVILSNIRTPLELYKVEHSKYPIFNQKTVQKNKAYKKLKSLNIYIDNFPTLIPKSISQGKKKWYFVNYKSNGDTYTLKIKYPDKKIKNMKLTPKGIEKINSDE